MISFLSVNDLIGLILNIKEISTSSDVETVLL